MKHNLKNEMKSFFANYGLFFDRPKNFLERKMQEEMGQQRYEVFCALFKAAANHEADRQELYAFLDTAAEANVFVSLQAKHLLEASTALYQAIQPRLTAGMRIADLGCFTGSFASWLASQHPDCLVAGVDANPKAIAFAEQLNKQPNASFVQWDYSQPDNPVPLDPCDVLVSTLGIEFDGSANAKHCRLDVGNLRDCDYYRFRKAEALPYLAHLRKAVTAGGLLVAVLRIVNVEQCLAFLDAAHESGWTADIGHKPFIRVDSGEDEQLPLLKLHAHSPAATDAQPLSDDQILSWWAGDDLDRVYKDDSAIAVYRVLLDKIVVESRQKTYVDGHTMQKVKGKAGPIGFQFSRATNGHADLRLVPVDKLDSLVLTFE